MALTHLQLGELYFTKGGILERRVLGCVLHMSQQILQGGYADPTAEQTAWATFVVGQDLAGHSLEARKALEWGLSNNATFQTSGPDAIDTDLDFIVAEYAKTYA